MSVLDRPDNVPVELGFCPCEGAPHPDGDVVYLYPELSTPAGLRLRLFFTDTLEGKRDLADFQDRLAEIYLQFCVADWTFLFDDGSPIPVTPENVVRALPYAKGGRQVADKADDLYVESVTVPLLAELKTLSQPGPTRATRRATSRRTTSTPKPRRPSSTATTAKVPAPE